jgi:hypothetical protein
MRDTVLHGIVGAFGLVFGLLSAVALAVAAVVPALLGLLAFVLTPVRAAVERWRQSR